MFAGRLFRRIGQTRTAVTFLSALTTGGLLLTAMGEANGSNRCKREAHCLWGKPDMGKDKAEITHSTITATSTTASCGADCISRLPQVSEAVAESVVCIRTEIGVSIRTGLFTRETNLAVSKGMGLVISADGLVLTNAHVVEDIVEGGSLYVITSDGETIDATLYALDIWSDLAIIKVNGDYSSADNQWKPVKFSSRHDKPLKSGTPLFTFGDPLGLGPSLSFGILSATSRKNSDLHMEGRMDSRMEYYQTNFTGFDCGYSGGPVFDMNGEVVAINVIKADDIPGIGFAVSIQSVERLIGELLKNGKVERPWIGLRVLSLTQPIIKQIYTRSHTDTNNGPPTSTETDSQSSVHWNYSWKSLTGWWMGSGTAHTEKSLLDEVPRDSGVNVVNDIGKLLDVANLDSGILTLSIFEGSPAEKAGCQVGDVITHVNGEEVYSTGDFFAAIGYGSGLESIELTVTRLTKDQKAVSKVKLKLQPELLDIWEKTMHPLNGGDEKNYEEYVQSLDKEQRKKAEFLK